MATEDRSAAELSNILPRDEVRDPTGKRLARLIERISRNKVPVTAWSRAWLLGSLQAKVAGGYFAFWLRGLFADVDGKARLKNEAHLAAALQLFGTMGYLRGAVLKVGQMLASFPEVVPEQFADVLAALHCQAPPMHYALIREVFLDEFGREPEELFAAFDRRAFAAASLGQVHRARLHSGAEVAVKIQYPDMARTIRADLRNLRLLLQPLRLNREWPHLREKLEDLEWMLLQEADYRREARFGKKLRDLFAPNDPVVVPRVYEDYSGVRVLTTDFLAGKHLDAFLASEPSQARRDHFTRLLVTATMRPFYRRHWVLADPNPGNFLFMEDGRLGLIDFGCTRLVAAEEWDLWCELEAAALSRDQARLDRAVAKACLFDDPAEIEPERLAAVGRFMRWQLEPRLAEEPFDFGDRACFLRGIEAALELGRKRYGRGAPTWIWTNRFTLGLRAMTYRLQGRCDLKGIYSDEAASR